MIGIVIAAHGTLASSFVDTVEIFAGKSEKLISVDLSPDAGPETFIKHLKEKTNEIDEGDGVLILADLYGGTPSNSSLRLIAENDNWLIVTGVNLTMLLEVVLNRNNCKSVQELAESAVNSSREGIQMLTPLITK